MAPTFPSGEDALKRSPGAEVTLDVQHSAPPTATYITKDDQLGIMIACSSQPAFGVQVNMRILLPSGKIVQSVWNVQPIQTRTGQTFFYPLPEGFLLSAAVTTPFVNQPRSTFCELILYRGANLNNLQNQILCSGYPAGYQVLSWPLGVNTNSLDTVGNIRSIVGTTPGAGAEISETVPVGAQWFLLAIEFGLTASATVATRVPQVIFDDGTNIFAQVVSPVNVTASSSIGLAFAIGLNTGSNVLGVANNSIPNNLKLMPSWRIRTNTGSLQAADQYSSPKYVVEEWLLP